MGTEPNRLADGCGPERVVRHRNRNQRGVLRQVSVQRCNTWSFAARRAAGGFTGARYRDGEASFKAQLDGEPSHAALQAGTGGVAFVVDEPRVAEGAWLLAG
jgi:hypothetical protein